MADAEKDELVAGLELLRGRIQRFCESDEAYAVAEVLSDRVADGHVLAPSTLEALERFSEDWRRGPSPELPAGAIARAEGIDLRAELAVRRRYVAPRRRQPTTVTFIVGAPRSGTSFLFNLLAYQGLFAYPTSLSCHRWPTWRLARSPRGLVDARPALLGVDTKALRLRGDVAIPSEYEAMFHRSAPVYVRQRGHHYVLRPCQVVDAELFRRDVEEHVGFFGADHYVSKSPFHSFRMDALCQLVGPACRFVHVHRDGRAVAASIGENGFGYGWADASWLTAGDAWATFVEAVLDFADVDRVLQVAYEELVAEPRRTAQGILDWLGTGAAARPLDAVAPLGAVRPPARSPELRTLRRVHNRLGRT